MALRTYCIFTLSLALLAVGGCSGETTSPADSRTASANTPGSSSTPAPSPSAPVGATAGTPDSSNSDTTKPATLQPAGPKAAAAVNGGSLKRRSRKKRITLPEVVLSEQHAATCRVQVGDKMPNLTVVDTNGESKALSSFLGDRVTVVCFWNPENPLSCWQLSDLGPEVLEQYASQGVNVVAISHGNKAQQSRQEADRVGVKFPVLVDQDGQAYEQVATRYLPRTYLMDGEGNILWFDLGYSDDTRRHLNQAIRFALADDTLPRGTIRQ